MSRSVSNCFRWRVQGFIAATLGFAATFGARSGTPLIRVARPPLRETLQSANTDSEREGVVRDTDGRHVFWSPRLRRSMWVDCDILLGWQYSIEWNVRKFFEQNPHLLASADTDASVFDETAARCGNDENFTLVEHCFSSVYFGLRDHNLSHEESLQEADGAYMFPLVAAHARGIVGRRCGGRDFVVVSAFDLGRADFVKASRVMENWTVLSLGGARDWLSESGVLEFKMPVSPEGPCEETGAWRLPLVHLEWRPQDSTLPVPCRHAWHSGKSASNERPVLAFFAGSLNSCSRRQLFELFGVSKKPSTVDDMMSTKAGNHDDHVIWVANGSLAPDHFEAEAAENLYREAMWASQYCIVLNGSSSTNNVRLIEAIMHGCVPVVVADDFQPPFHRELPWAELAIFLRTRELPFLPALLAQLGRGAAEAKRRVLLDIAPLLDVRDQRFWSLLVAAAMHGTTLSLAEDGGHEGPSAPSVEGGSATNEATELSRKDEMGVETGEALC